jgi:hypothetical protein
MERDRTVHRVHEARVRILGIVFMVRGGLRLGTMAIAAISYAWDPSSINEDFGGLAMLGTFGVLYTVAGALSAAGGWGMHQLKPWGRVAGLVVSAISLLSIPVGTLLGVWGGVLLLTPKGRRVLAPDYAAIRTATPYLRWKPQLSAVIAAAVVSGLMILGCGGLLLLGA